MAAVPTARQRMDPTGLAGRRDLIWHVRCRLRSPLHGAAPVLRLHPESWRAQPLTPADVHAPVRSACMRRSTEFRVQGFQPWLQEPSMRTCKHLVVALPLLVRTSGMPLAARAYLIARGTMVMGYVAAVGLGGCAEGLCKFCRPPRLPCLHPWDGYTWQALIRHCKQHVLTGSCQRIAEVRQPPLPEGRGIVWDTLSGTLCLGPPLYPR